MSEKRLTEKQRRFVEAYMGVACGNATEAARLAGYKGTENTLSQAGRANLRKSQIAALIVEHRDKDPLVLSRVQLQELWSRVSDGIVKKGEPPLSWKDRLRAGELLAKSRGEFLIRKETTVRGGVLVVPGTATEEEWEAATAGDSGD